MPKLAYDSVAALVLTIAFATAMSHAQTYSVLYN